MVDIIQRLLDMHGGKMAYTNTSNNLRLSAVEEITQLRAELARLRDVDGLYQILFRDFCDRGKIINTLESDLAAERELADRTMRALAESRNWNCIDLEDDRDYGVDVDTITPHLVKLDREISEILAAHATRRNK